MKKFFALLLVVLMLVPFIMACDDGPDTDTNSTPTQNTNTDTSKPSDTNTSTGTDTDVPGEPTDKKDVDAEMTKYNGSTVNIMAAPWSNGEAGAPWSQVELSVVNWDESGNGWGITINNGVMERKEYIENTYGVSLNWINCGGSSMLNKLTQAAMNKGQVGEEIIHIAMPHVFEAMQIVVDDAVYEMGSDYINFDAEYFSQESVEQYTLAGHTFFAGGDISFLDEQTAYVLFFNNAVAEEFKGAFPNLYEATLNGTWTIDTLYDLSGSVSENLDGKDEYTDADKYGLGTNQLDCYFQYFGVYQVGKSKDSEGNEVFALTIENDKVSQIVDKMLFATKNQDSIRTSWSGGYGALGEAFGQNRLLFYHEVLQKVFNIDENTNYGILPFPKLSTDQTRYYVPGAQQATIVCIPRATDDRVLSECMVEILAKTASEYIMPAYTQAIRERLNEDYVDDAMEVIEKQIYPNLMFDIGYMYGRFGGDGSGLVTDSIQAEAIAGNINNFANAVLQGKTQAEKLLGDWSYAYNVYVDEY
ncbi:MAG: hypothetical protein II984_01410 [Clostridia bacterium]|nr:hypothetical protein [Clostridia bacterium]